MRDDYKLQGSTAGLQIEIEIDVVKRIHAMEKFTGLSVAELTNTALKRFIAHHSDFLPVESAKKKV